MNKFLIDCCVCIQCVILKINNNNNKNPDWFDFYLYSSHILFDQPSLKTVIFHLMEDCCVCGNSVSFFCCFFFFFLLAESLRLNKSLYLIDLFINKCYIDVKDCINCRDSIGKTLYRCNLLHSSIV